MPKPPRYLKQLEHELLALGDDAMLLEELDGFIAGLLVCPELIKPSEWLPVVWGSEGEDDTAFDSLDHLNRVLGLVMEHYNDVARTLIERPDRYGPRFAVDKRHNEILWEIWVAGFEKAVKLRPAAWQKLLTADRDGTGDVRPSRTRLCRPPRLPLHTSAARRSDHCGPASDRPMGCHAQ